jgi:predicted O-methyltransferase YrrM
VSGSPSRSDEPAPVAEPEAHTGTDRLFASIRDSGRLRTVKLEQLFPGITKVPVEIGAIDPDTGHANHVDMLYVVAVARYRRAMAIFEFGTYLGRTTYHLALGNPDAVVHTLDLRPELVRPEQKIGGAIRSVIERGHQGAFFRDTPCASRIRQLHGDSRSFDYAPFRGKMDFIFIDASHLYEFVRNDTSKAMEMLAPGGIVLWHDFAPKSEGVVRFVGEFMQTRPLFHIERTSLVIHIDGVDPSSAELSPAFLDKRGLK